MEIPKTFLRHFSHHFHRGHPSIASLEKPSYVTFFFPPLAWRRVDANVKWITEKHKGFPFSAIRCPAAVLRLNLFRTFLLRPQQPRLRDDVSLVAQAVLTQFETLYVL